MLRLLSVHVRDFGFHLSQQLPKTSFLFKIASANFSEESGLRMQANSNCERHRGTIHHTALLVLYIGVGEAMTHSRAGNIKSAPLESLLC